MKLSYHLLVDRNEYGYCIEFRNGDYDCAYTPGSTVHGFSQRASSIRGVGVGGRPAWTIGLALQVFAIYCEYLRRNVENILQHRQFAVQ